LEKLTKRFKSLSLFYVNKMKQIIIINLKTYKQGKDLIELAKKIEEYNPESIIGAQVTDISELTKNTKLPVYSQHVDSLEVGRATGFILPEAVKENGAIGTFLNHSEHPLKFKVIKDTVKRCKDIGLKVAVFAPNIKEAKKIEKLKPDYLIIEPPELVAGDISISKANPGLIKNLKKELKMDFLVGAGIKTKEDIDIAMNLGSVGFAISSAITKAENPSKKLKELFG
jgi:triosephosphate isomerase (TIM)